MRKRTFVRSALTLGLASALAPIRAQAAFPNRPITLVVPFSAGGGGDSIARLVGKELGARTGTSVIVDNRTGAGGNIGAAYVLKSKPDGYTLLNISSTYAIQAVVSKTPFDAIADMQPITMMARDPTIILSAKSSPIRDVKTLVATAKTRPGRITYGSAGVGSIAHLGMVELGLVLGIDMQHIPYKGSSQVFTDLVAGSIDLMLTGTSFAAPQMHGGRIQALGVTGEKRSSILPEVPTFAEQGIPQYQSPVWKAICGPKGIPGDVVAYLNRELNAVLLLPSVSDQLSREGSIIIGGSPDQLMEVIRGDIDHWKSVISRGHVQIE
jgi:tripartite-type tricarboxylate transporter receptor subunit TctC